MKKKSFFNVSLLMIPAVAIFAFLSMNYTSGLIDGRSGSPGDGGVTCAACHGGGNFGLTPSITTNIPAAGYSVNTMYTINVKSTSSSSWLGFQLTAENGSNVKIGTLMTGTGTRVGNKRITQSTPSSTGNWSFNWMSPSTNLGDVTFYACVNATNGQDNTSGDQVLTTSTKVKVLGISEAKRLHFSMFPNPSTNELTIQLPSGSVKATVEFYDYIGKLSLTKTIFSSNDVINVNNLNSGVYIVKVISSDKIGSEKFIKQ